MTTLGLHQWNALSIETRKALAKIFNLKASGFTHVVDNRIDSDGYTYEDLQPMNVEELKLLTHLKSDSFEDQFTLMVKMVEGEVYNFNAPAEAEAETLQQDGEPTSAERTDTGSEAKDEGAVSPGSGSQTQAGPGQGKAVPFPGGSKPKHRGRSKSVPSGNGLDQAGMAKQATEVDPGILKADADAGLE